MLDVCMCWDAEVMYVHVCVCVCVCLQMVNRSFIVKQLQKPAKGLRRRVPARNVSGNAVVSTTASASAPSAVQSVGTQELQRASLSSVNAGTGLPSPSSPRGHTPTGGFTLVNEILILTLSPQGARHRWVCTRVSYTSLVRG